MRHRSWLLLFLVPVTFSAIWACTGDDPILSTEPGTSDGGMTDDGSVSSDGSNSNDGQSPLCTNGKKDDGETDVDCGGTCAKCIADQACKLDGDCLGGKCTAGYCEFVKLAWLPGPVLPLTEPTFDAGSKDNALGRELFSAIAAEGTIRAVAGYAQVAVDGGKGVSMSEHFIDVGAGDTQWSIMTSVIGPRRYSASAVGANGKMYIFCGEGESGGTPYMAPATWGRDAHPVDAGVWQTQSNELTVTRKDFAVAAGPDGYLYAFGGATDVNTTTFTDVIEAFGPAASPAWGQISAKMTSNRIGLAAVSGKDGKIYLLGGGTPTGPTRIVEAFDVTTKTFTARADMLDPHGHFAAVAAPDGRIYAIAGDILSNSQASTHVEAFSPTTNTWTKVADLPNARIGHGAVLGPDGRIWVISGAKSIPGYELVAQVDIYGPKVALGAPSVAAGGTIAVSGSNFAPNAPIRIYVDEVKGAPIANGTASVQGVLPSVTVNVPSSVPPGNHRIVAVDDLSRYPVSAQASVLAN